MPTKPFKTAGPLAVACSSANAVFHSLRLILSAALRRVLLSYPRETSLPVDTDTASERRGVDPGAAFSAVRVAGDYHGSSNVAFSKPRATRSTRWNFAEVGCSVFVGAEEATEPPAPERGLVPWPVTPGRSRPPRAARGAEKCRL